MMRFEKKLNFAAPIIALIDLTVLMQLLCEREN